MIYLVLMTYFLSFSIIFISYHIGYSFGDDYNIFRKFLIKKIKKENVLVFEHKNTKSLNLHIYKKYSHLKYAGGIYSYYENYKNNSVEYINQEIHISKKQPQILTNKSISVLMIFAHEIGHHFEITRNNNNGEKVADEYSIKLLKECFPNKYYLYLPIILYIKIGSFFKN